MSRSHQFYGFWEEYDGREVIIDGKPHILRMTVYEQRYPYRDTVIDVRAEQQPPGSNKYDVSVLDSDPDLQVELLMQLGYEEKEDVTACTEAEPIAGGP